MSIAPVTRIAQEPGKRLDGEKITLEKTTGILNKLQQRFNNIPGSLSAELIEERRAEAARAELLSRLRKYRSRLPQRL